jgi:hypothetical protein
MTIFTIDAHHNITAFGSTKEAKSNPEAERFRSAKQLARLAEKWPASRLVEIWNALPDQKPAHKFTSRKAAVTRIWKAIQSLTPDRGPQAPRVARKEGKPGQRASRVRQRGTAREGSKAAQIVELLRRPNGVTLKDLMAATQWQAHSVRGFISGALRKKLGLTVDFTKRPDGERSYSIKAGPSPRVT